MSFIDDVKYRSLVGRCLSYSVVNFGGEAAYIEGIWQLVSVSTEKIVLRVKSALIAIEGEGLWLSELEGETAIISGKISVISEVWNENTN